MSRLARLAWVLAAVAALAGCSTTGRVTMTSATADARVVPAVRLVAYVPDSSGSADIYLTDLPVRELDPAVSNPALTGHLIHLRLFIAPRPGRTPIEPSACSVTVRYAILSRGEVGLYTGGGFLLPSGSVGDESLGGSMSGATMRLGARSQGFIDRLGAASMDVSFRAPRDPALAALIARRLDEAAQRAATPTPP